MSLAKERASLPPHLAKLLGALEKAEVTPLMRKDWDKLFLPDSNFSNRGLGSLIEDYPSIFRHLTVCAREDRAGILIWPLQIARRWDTATEQQKVVGAALLEMLGIDPGLLVEEPRPVLHPLARFQYL